MLGSGFVFCGGCVFCGCCVDYVDWVRSCGSLWWLCRLKGVLAYKMVAWVVGG